MKPSKAVIVEIEHCQNCHLHAWCSRHDESKYIEHTERIRSHALNVFQHCDFRVNQPQHSYENINQPTSKGETKYYDHEAKEIINFPRFGSFEIFVNGALVFSKIQSNLWPNHDRIGVLFEKIKQEIENNNTMEKYSLQYRLKNDEDQFFRQTYKKAIERNRRPSLTRPLSQNHSQVLNHGNRSPSNTMKHGNHNFISRKVHQSLRKNLNSQIIERQEFFKPYKGETRPATKGVRRPNTNLHSKVTKNPAIEFNKHAQNYQFDSNDLINDDEIIVKGSPNPRRRLHILKDTISKHQGTNSNHGQFNSNKQPLTIKTKARNITNDNEPESKKIIYGSKPSSQSHQSNIIQKNNNWTTTPKGLTPINDMSKKNDKIFKRGGTLKNDHKLKLGPSEHKEGEKPKVSNTKAEYNEIMQRNQQRLIAKLQQSDSKELKHDAIQIFSRNEQPITKPQESKKDIHINNNNNNFDDERVKFEFDTKQISFPNRHSSREQKIQQKPQQKIENKGYTEQQEEEYFGEEFNNDAENDEGEHSSVVKGLVQSARVNDQQINEQTSHKLLPKHHSNSQQQYQHDLIRDEQQSDDKQQPLQEEYQDDYNNEEEPTQVQEKGQNKVSSIIKVSNNNTTQYVHNEDEERKKSTSLEESLFNRPQNNHPDTVMQLSSQHNFTTDQKVNHPQYGTEELKGWSKKEDDLVYEGYSQFKIAQKHDAKIAAQAVSVQHVKVTNTSINNVKEDEVWQEENYQEQEEEINVQQPSMAQNQKSQLTQEKVEKPISTLQQQQSNPTIQQQQSNQQNQIYEEEFVQQIEEDQPQQRPQSRDSRVHSQRQKTISQQSNNQNVVKNESLLSNANQGERDFTKKQNSIKQIQNKQQQEHMQPEMKTKEKQQQQIHSNKHLQEDNAKNQTLSQLQLHTESIVNQQHYHQQLNALKHSQPQQEFPAIQQPQQQQKHQQLSQDQDYQQQQQQQLQDIQQSHHSIPIIVSANDGTNKIIQEQVREDLQQIYLQQEKQREKKQEILQNMITDEGEVHAIAQQQSHQHEQKEKNDESPLQEKGEQEKYQQQLYLQETPQGQDQTHPEEHDHKSQLQQQQQIVEDPQQGANSRKEHINQQGEILVNEIEGEQKISKKAIDQQIPATQDKKQQDHMDNVDKEATENRNSLGLQQQQEKVVNISPANNNISLRQVPMPTEYSLAAHEYIENLGSVINSQEKTQNIINQKKEQSHQKEESYQQTKIESLQEAERNELTEEKVGDNVMEGNNKEQVKQQQCTPEDDNIQSIQQQQQQTATFVKTKPLLQQAVNVEQLEVNQKQRQMSVMEQLDQRQEENNNKGGDKLDNEQDHEIVHVNHTLSGKHEEQQQQQVKQQQQKSQQQQQQVKQQVKQQMKQQVKQQMNQQQKPYQSSAHIEVKRQQLRVEQTQQQHIPLLVQQTQQKQPHIPLDLPNQSPPQQQDLIPQLELTHQQQKQQKAQQEQQIPTERKIFYKQEFNDSEDEQVVKQNVVVDPEIATERKTAIANQQVEQNHQKHQQQHQQQQNVIQQNHHESDSPIIEQFAQQQQHQHIEKAQQAKNDIEQQQSNRIKQINHEQAEIAPIVQQQQIYQHPNQQNHNNIQQQAQLLQQEHQQNQLNAEIVVEQSQPIKEQQTHQQMHSSKVENSESIILPSSNHALPQFLQHPSNHTDDIQLSNQPTKKNLQFGHQSDNRSPQTTEKIIKNQIESLNLKISLSQNQYQNTSLKEILSENTQRIVKGEILNINQKLVEKNLISQEQIDNSQINSSN